MTTIFFVHGTGVRARGKAQTVAHIKRNLDDIGYGEVKVAAPDWGALHGAKITEDDIRAFLPAAADKGLGETLSTDAELWGQLLVDPLFEFRFAAASTSPVRKRASPVAVSPSETFKQRLRSLDVSTGSPTAGVSVDALRAAAKALADGEGAGLLATCVDALGDVTDAKLAAASARAIVAFALREARDKADYELGEGPDALFVASERRSLVAYVTTRLAPITKGDLDGWLSRTALDFAKTYATPRARRERMGLMTSAGPGVGDILLYQRRGKAISDFLRAEIAALEDENVVALGHSLGGILLVDLLSSAQPHNVKSLVTIGSQAAVFFAANALSQSRDRGNTVIAIPWLNIYDRNDFLSFCIEAPFSGDARRKDFEIASDVPFPESHGAYFRKRETYERLAAFCWPKST